MIEKRLCKCCQAEVEEERVELLDSHVCSTCAKDGQEQEKGLRGATIYDQDGIAEIQLMDARDHEKWLAMVRARDSAHSCA